jgi:hypothetical protein
VAFVVVGEAAVRGDPRQGTFDRPAARQRREAALAVGFADDLDRGLQDVGGPLDQPPGETGVGEDDTAPQRGVLGAKQGLLGAVAVLHLAASTTTTISKPRLSVTMNPLAAVDLLAGVVPPCVPPDRVGALHTLGVDDPRARRRPGRVRRAAAPAAPRASAC